MMVWGRRKESPSEKLPNSTILTSLRNPLPAMSIPKDIFRSDHLYNPLDLQLKPRQRRGEKMNALSISHPTRPKQSSLNQLSPEEVGTFGSCPSILGKRNGRASKELPISLASVCGP